MRCDHAERRSTATVRVAALVGVSLLVAVALGRYPDRAPAGDHVAVIGAGAPGRLPSPATTLRTADAPAATTEGIGATDGSPTAAGTDAGRPEPLLPVDTVVTTPVPVGGEPAPAQETDLSQQRAPAGAVPAAQAAPDPTVAPPAYTPAPAEPAPVPSAAPAPASPPPPAPSPPAPAPPPPPVAPAGDFADGLEWSSFSLINGERAAAGLPALGFDGGLQALARAQALAMAEAGSLFHQDLGAVLAAGWGTGGENVGRGGSVVGLHGAFVRSGAHYANLVGAGFSHVGIAVLSSPDGGLWVVQVFGG